MRLKQVFKQAQKKGYAIGQFNFSTFEQLRAIFAAAGKMKSPFILGTSESELNFLGVKAVLALKEIIALNYDIPVFLNLDHGKNMSIIKDAIDYGYDAVQYDGSKLSFAENIKNTKKIVNYARKRNVLVEGELGHIKGDSSFQTKSVKILESELTPVDQVKEYVEKTKVDSLAVAIGSIHGVYRKMPELNIPHLKNIRKQTNTFLVLHGASGIKDKEISSAIKQGIVKINFNTELRKAWKDSFQKMLSKNEIKPYNIIPFVEEQVAKKVEEKIKLIGSKNKA